MSEMKSARPLSPHLSIYRFKPTMAMSILHRITGVGLYLGTVFFVWWLLAAASGPGAFAFASGFFGSFIGRLFLFAYSWVLFHHMFGGLRHFVWDMGYMITREQSTLAAQATPIASLAATVLLWLIVWIV